jgi:hypothetical protein
MFAKSRKPAPSPSPTISFAVAADACGSAGSHAVRCARLDRTVRSRPLQIEVATGPPLRVPVLGTRVGHDLENPASTTRVSALSFVERRAFPWTFDEDSRGFPAPEIQQRTLVGRPPLRPARRPPRHSNAGGVRRPICLLSPAPGECQELRRPPGKAQPAPGIVAPVHAKHRPTLV